jgi:succinate dehydrogenase/fumarate reductase flavoprotein subunit
MTPIPQDAHGEKPAMQVGRFDPGTDTEIETDVVIVGAGAAGLAAANGAASAGCQVIVLDARAEPGGTTTKSAGGFMVTANRLHREAGVIENRALTMRFLAKVSFPDRYNPDDERLGLDQLEYDLIATFYDRSDEVISALEADKVLTLGLAFSISGEPRGLPSYFTQLDEETIYYGRTLGPVTPDGMAGWGRELVRQLLAGAERRGVQVVCDQRVGEILIADDGEVAGVSTGTNRFLARKGVIFASGGFAQNRELIEEHMPGLVLGSCAVSASQGDFLALTRDLDVEIAHLDKAWWGEVPAELAIESPEVTALLFYPYGDSMIYVDRRGRRVVNEKAVYDQRAPVHFVRDETAEQPNRLLFMIYDQAVARDPHDTFPARYPVPAAGDSASYVIEAPTLDELEEEIRDRLATIAPHTGDLRLAPDFGAELRRTIATFNGYAERGVDPEFHRGEEPIQVDGAGPGRLGSHPNRTMYPISSRGPYYCIITAAGVLDTKGGPRIDTRARVLRTDGSPVPRLYAAGNCAASPAAAGYWAGGTTIGLAMTYGYIAGQDAVQLAPRTARPAVLTAG